MKDFLAKLLTVCRLVAGLLRRAFEAFLRFCVWVSPPQRLAVAVIACLFTVSLLAWSIGDRVREAILYFPSARGSAIKAELRNVPRAVHAEDRAELVASEFLLGPATPGLKAGLPSGARVISTIYRRGTLYLNLSEEAALGDRPELTLGLAALEKTLRATLPGMRHFVVTIGGFEPYKLGLASAPEAPKKSEKN